MDTALILRKLENLGRCIGRIESKRPADPQLLRRDHDLQDIISVNLERAVQISVDVASHLIAESPRRSPETMAECFAALEEMGVLDKRLAARLQKAVGFRNVAVHEYQEIDWDVVFSIISRDLDDFRSYARRILEYCELGLG